MKALHRLGLAALVMLAAAGCAEKAKPLIRKLSEVRAGQPQARVVETSVARDQYLEATKNLDAVNRLRLVPILQGGDGETADSLPEYRMFNVDANSPYALIGMRENDVLIAADDAVIYEPARFKLFMQALFRDPNPFIEIRRGAEPMVIKIVWTGAIPASALHSTSIAPAHK